MTVSLVDDYKAGFVAAMGDPLGEQFHALWLDVTWLTIKWSQFVEIFGTAAERISLLNKAAPSFFLMVENAFWQDTLLHLTRLTDAPQSVGKDNLTIANLPDLIACAETSKAVRELVNIAKKSTEFCRDWRNRHIAHQDLKLALGDDAIPLAEGSRDHVTKALDAIYEVLYEVRRAYLGSSPPFQAGHTIGGATALLRVLEGGVSGKASKE
ncbi:MAG TPA: hypothetical protein VKQ73_10830 [Stellaceae bacterium]|nr:hypothetical protein [Stellaceae bacterium]